MSLSVPWRSGVPLCPTMRFADAVAHHDVILGSGSMYERLRRSPHVEFDPHVANASLIYDDEGRGVVAAAHGEYIDIAREAGLPMLVSTGTWRTSRRRVEASNFRDRPLNRDHVRFSQELADNHGQGIATYVGGVLGPHGDGYDPAESLGVDEAERLHMWQAEQLADAGVDVLMAMTLPALSEARGLARAMAATGLDYVLSFVVRDTGTLLDGTPLLQAIETLDGETSRRPVGYFANCVHPNVLVEGLAAQPRWITDRFLGIKANTSSQRPEELDGRDALISADPEQLADDLHAAHRALGLTFVGGCCGTNALHMRQLAARFTG